MNEMGKLFIKYPEKVSQITVYPEGALTLTRQGETPGKWVEYGVLVAGHGLKGDAHAVLGIAR